MPQPDGQVLIALRLKTQLEKHFGLHLGTDTRPMDIVHEILQGFTILETTNVTPFFTQKI